MPVTLSQTSWGHYMQYEGPAYYGHLRYKADGVDLLEKAFLVTSETEGALNSVNMYDSCIMTVGAVQWCDRGSFAVTDMVGKVVEACGLDYVLNVFDAALKISNATFKQNAVGKWRFYLDGGKTEVNTIALQQRLYLSCSGAVGSYTPEAMTHARTWCAAMGSLWDDERAQKAQIDYTKPKLMSFVFGGATAIFADKSIPETGWTGMLKAAVISYCINSPANVSKAVTSGIAASKSRMWSPEWCLDILNAITFVGVNTFVARYNAIRPVLEAQFGVTLPKTSGDLQKRGWVITPPAPVSVPEPIVVEQTPAPMPVEAPPFVAPTPPPVEAKVSSTSLLADPTNSKFTHGMHWLILLFGFWGRVIMEIVKHFKK